MAISLTIGAIAYFVERLNNHSRTASLAFGSLALLVAILVAALKAMLVN